MLENVPAARFPADRARPQTGESISLHHIPLKSMDFKGILYFVPQIVPSTWSIICACEIVIELTMES